MSVSFSLSFLFLLCVLKRVFYSIFILFFGEVGFVSVALPFFFFFFFWIETWWVG